MKNENKIKEGHIKLQVVTVSYQFRLFLCPSEFFQCFFTFYDGITLYMNFNDEILFSISKGYTYMHGKDTIKGINKIHIRQIELKTIRTRNIHLQYQLLKINLKKKH